MREPKLLYLWTPFGRAERAFRSRPRFERFNRSFTCRGSESSALNSTLATDSAHAGALVKLPPVSPILSMPSVTLPACFARPRVRLFPWWSLKGKLANYWPSTGTRRPLRRGAAKVCTLQMSNRSAASLDSGSRATPAPGFRHGCPIPGQEVALTEELGYASLGLCTALPYPLTPPPSYPVQIGVKLFPIPHEQSMADPCAGVPQNNWCTAKP